MARQTVAMVLNGSLLVTLHVGASPGSAAAMDERTESSTCPVTVVSGGNGGVYANDSIGVVLWPESKFVFKPNGPGFIDRDGALGLKGGWELRKIGTLSV